MSDTYISLTRVKVTTLSAAALFVVLDQVIKSWAYRVLPHQPITVIPGFFNLRYLENTGAAFGLFQDATLILTIVSVIVIIALTVWFLSNKVQNTLMIIGIALILAGGIGNCIDRIYRGFVIDYLDFSAVFGFPIFNFADICVVIGIVLFLIYVLIFEKNADNETSKAKSDKEDAISGED